MKGLTIVVVVMLFSLVVVGQVIAVPIPNGDFGGGNTGFTSAYLYFAQPGVPATGYTDPKSSLYDEGTYGVGTNPALYHGSWASFGDHTTGTGNMMIVNGDMQANVQVWASPVSPTTIPVTFGQTYYFSAWLASVYPAVGNPPIAPAMIALIINGNQIGTDFTLSAPVGTWEQFYVPWVADSAFANLSLIDKNLTASGNDFALDDISLNPVPEPATMLFLVSTVIGLVGLSGKFKN